MSVGPPSPHDDGPSGPDIILMVLAMLIAASVIGWLVWLFFTLLVE